MASRRRFKGGRQGRGLLHRRHPFLRWTFRAVLQDPLAILALAVLVVLGQLNLRAIGEQDLANRELLMTALGGALLLGLTHLRAQDWPWIARPAYVAAVAALLAVDVAGSGAMGAQRWLSLGPLVVQPSELAKVALLVVLADVVGVPRLRSARALAGVALAAVPIMLTWREPDLSTTVLLVVVAFGALAIARAPIRVFMLLGAGAAAATPLVFGMLKPYQLERLRAVAGQGEAAYSALQANIALATGGMFGVVGQPMHEVMSRYLPARETDLAFASLIQQWGILAGLAAVAATVLLLLRLVFMARRAPTPTGSVFCGALAVLLAAEAAVSMFGNLGRIPLAGVPYPLLSYGGTTAVAHLAAVGIAISTHPEATSALWRFRIRWRLPARLYAPLAAALAIMIAAGGWFAWQDQKAFADVFRGTAYKQMTRCGALPAARGPIEDRHGAPLAVNDPGLVVYAAPGLVLRSRDSVDRLAAALGTPPAQLRQLLYDDRQKVVTVVPDVGDEAAKRVDQARLAGVAVIASNVRHYPEGAAAGSLLGFTGIVGPGDPRRLRLRSGAVVGQAGVEQQYDDVLRGVDGELCVFVDPANVAVGLASVSLPRPGHTLRLSIDAGLQRVAVQRLAAAVAGVPAADLGGVVVMDAGTGAILALASVPSYDNNVFSQPMNADTIRSLAAPRGYPMLEHNTQVAMPPGSTFKLVVATADVVHGAIPPAQVIPTGYTYATGGTVLHGWGSLPPQNLPQAIAWSNDVYFYKLADALQPERIADVAHQLGVGVASGIDLPDEEAGIVATPAEVEAWGETWYPAVTAMMGIGQGYTAATPLQVALYTGAVTTGTLVTPRLALAAGSGPELDRLPPPPPRALPFADRLGPVREGLRLAVTEGTGTMLKDLPQPAGGKTGTAEDPSAPGGVDAWFTSVAPMDGSSSPIVVTVAVRGGGEGHQVSEPAARDIWGAFYANPAAVLQTPATVQNLPDNEDRTPI